MAKISNSTCILSCASTASLQSWVGPILQLLSDAGWIRTSDTGQTELANMPAASAAGTVCGYQIWRMNDSLQATAPVFVKFEFGSGSLVTNASLWVTIGTGSDGAGNITGIIQSQTRMYATTSNYAATTAISFYGRGDSSSLVFCANCLSNTSQKYVNRIFFSVERTHDSSGADTNQGVMILGEAPYGGSATATFGPVYVFRVATLSGSQPATSTSVGAYVPSGTTWAYDGNYVGVCPVSYFLGAPTNPSKNLAVYLNADISALVPVTIPCYGFDQDWLPLGPSLVCTVASSNANSSFLIRWD